MGDLTTNDPEVERLRGITEDKVPESMNMGMESPWTIRFEGNPQVFAKDDVNNVYGVAVLRNIFWPGWTTIGYVLCY